MNIDNHTTLANLTYEELSEAVWHGKPMPLPNGGLIHQGRQKLEKWAEENQMPQALIETHPFMTKNAIEWKTYVTLKASGTIAQTPLKDAKDKQAPPVAERSGYMVRNTHSLQQRIETITRSFDEAHPMIGGTPLLRDVQRGQGWFKNPHVIGSGATNHGKINSELYFEIDSLSGHLRLNGPIDFAGPTDGILEDSNIAGITGSTARFHPDAKGKGINATALGCIHEIEKLKAPAKAIFKEAIEFMRKGGDVKEGQKKIDEAKRMLADVKSEVEKYQVNASGLLISPTNPSTVFVEKLRQDRINNRECPWELVEAGIAGVRLKTSLPQALDPMELDRMIQDLRHHLAEEELAQRIIKAPGVLFFGEIQALRKELRLSYAKMQANELVEKFPSRLIISETMVEIFFAPIPSTPISKEQFLRHSPRPPAVATDDKGRISVGGEIVFDPLAEVPSPIGDEKFVSHIVDKNNEGFVVGIREKVHQRTRFTYGPVPKRSSNDAVKTLLKKRERGKDAKSDLTEPLGAPSENVEVQPVPERRRWMDTPLATLFGRR